MEEIPLEMDINWKIVTILMVFEERITMILTAKVPAKNWLGKTLKKIIQAVQE